MDVVFKTPQPRNKHRRLTDKPPPLQSLLDLDESILTNFITQSGNGDELPSSAKRLKICPNHNQTKILEDDNDVISHFLNDELNDSLDDDPDFTLMQFFQGTQANVKSNASFIKSETNNSKSNSIVFNEKVDEELLEMGFSQPLSASQFNSHGSFYGLPDKVKRLVKEHKGISKLYDWQDECLNLKAVLDRRNLIYALPTSSGKTLVAEILIFRELICNKRDVLFILPFVSIVKEKISALAPFAVDLNFYMEEYAAGQGVCPPRERRSKRSVYIATIEKSLALVNSLIEVDRINEIGLVVVDELHLLGEPGRGAILETVLTKVKLKTLTTQIIGMSATIGNMHEVEKFLNAVIFRREFRPVKLKEYIKCGKDIYAVDKNSADLFIPVRSTDFGYDSQMSKVDYDHVAGLVMEVAPKYSVLIFCPVKKNCQDVALNLTRILTKDFLDHRKSEKELVLQLLRHDSNRICEILKRTIPFGVAYHHSGLTVDERRIIEDAFRAGVICVICCTSTLAAGVNLPAKRVLIRSPYVCRDFLTQSRYKQMIGRAGRAGFDVLGESFLIVSRKDKKRVHELIDSPMTDAISSMHLNDFYGLKNLILSAIAMRIAYTVKSLKRLANETFLAVQADRLSLNLGKEVEKIIKSFFKLNALSLKRKTLDLDVSVAIDSTQMSEKLEVRPSQVIIKSSSELEISEMGTASVKACIDLVKARSLYLDLKNAQRGLVLLDYLHLLYLVTPPDVNIYPKMGLFYEKYNKLTPDQIHTANMVGISESMAVKIMTGKSLTTDQQNLVNRFFVTLILQDLWNLKNVYEVSISYGVNRGLVQNLMSLSASYAFSVSKFCQEIKEFWAFDAILDVICKRLRYCCSAELVPLMELPAVRLGRARQLHSAGFKTVEVIAKSDPNDLVSSVEFLSLRQAKQIVAAAIVILKDKMDNLQDEVDFLRNIIGARI